MKSCTHMDPLQLQRYHDGELQAPDDAVGAHAAACPDCRAARDAMDRLGEAIRRSYDQVPRAELTSGILQRAREMRNRASRRVAWSLMAAASVLFVSSLFFVAYTQAGGSDVATQMAQWERLVLSTTPVVDEEHPESDVSSSLYAIHLQRSSASDDGND